MVDRETLKQAARYRTNEQGQRIVEIPADLWEEWVAEELQPSLSQQNKELLELLDNWESNPDNTPPEWWDDFQAFLRTHRLDLLR